MEVLIAYSAEKIANYVPGFVLIDLVIGEPGIFLSGFTRWSGKDPASEGLQIGCHSPVSGPRSAAAFAPGHEKIDQSGHQHGGN